MRTRHNGWSGIAKAVSVGARHNGWSGTGLIGDGGNSGGGSGGGAPPPPSGMQSVPQAGHLSTPMMMVISELRPAEFQLMFDPANLGENMCFFGTRGAVVQISVNPDGTWAMPAGLLLSIDGSAPSPTGSAIFDNQWHTYIFSVADGDDTTRVSGGAFLFPHAPFTQGKIGMLSADFNQGGSEHQKYDLSILDPMTHVWRNLIQPSTTTLNGATLSASLWD
ncbi:hypothetical protein NVP1121O_032 [Vibrio phage 1.121.O._10N.286.46.C4]|nr:hypothetical protein NVP1121O_032 [Vibrio phage 1.121.O._10N.286.46.C4]